MVCYSEQYGNYSKFKLKIRTYVLCQGFFAIVYFANEISKENTSEYG